MKKKVLKRMLSVLLAGTMMASVLTGCGDGGDKPSGDASQPAENQQSNQSADASQADGGGRKRTVR